VLTIAGNSYNRIREHSKAIIFFEKTLEKDSENFFGLLGMGHSYRGLYEYEKAVQYFERILKQQPDNQIVLTRTGDAYLNMGDLNSAESLYRRAIEKSPDIFAFLGLAKIDMKRGEWEKAEKALKELRDKFPHNQRIKKEYEDCKKHRC
jgi:tetratricopeptide (TPR) repeat protein